jgi:hypothetical protein
MDRPYWSSAASGCNGSTQSARGVGRTVASRTAAAGALVAALLLLSRSPSAGLLAPGALSWHYSGRAAIRGTTIGPIESALHPDRGYGTRACARAMRQTRSMGANWVSITPFGRVWGLAPTGVSLTFEAPFPSNREAVKLAIRQAHAEGLRVLVIPQLWVETGAWRGEIDPGTDVGWRDWADAYRSFILEWAGVAAEEASEMFAVGVELRSWAATTRAPSFIEVIRDVRSVYPGLLTYAANWDDADDTVIWGELDAIGVNAFYPLAEQPDARLETLAQGAEEAARQAERLAHMWDKPVVFTEFGYSARPDPALRPWEWPEHVTAVAVDQAAQAEAYHALLAAVLDRPWFVGFFVWRMYADPDDVSQEPEWGFSPRGKLAELVLRDAFGTWMASDGPRPLGAALCRRSAQRVGVY